MLFRRHFEPHMSKVKNRAVAPQLYPFIGFSSFINIIAVCFFCLFHSSSTSVSLDLLEFPIRN